MTYSGDNDPSRISWGKHSYGDPKAITYNPQSGGRVSIGNFCSIAADVIFLLDGEHDKSLITTSPMLNLSPHLPPTHNHSKGPIIIDHDVWIGRGAIILSNVHIATGAIIGAYAVVTHDVAPYVIVAGNPAQPISRRFTVEQTKRLLKTEWWNWSDSQIQTAVHLLHDSNVEAFLNLATTLQQG